MPLQGSTNPKKTRSLKPAKRYASARSISSAEVREYELNQRFPYGYRNREDVTTLPPGVMTQGSQNVLTNTFQRIGVRKGYTLDGQRDTTTAPILSAFDWERHTGDTRNLRAGLNTTGSNGKLQYRYVATAGDRWNGNVFTEGQVYWIDLMTSLSSVRFNFCDFWDFNSELKSELLFVKGDANIHMWSGGVTTLQDASNAAGVISTLNATPTAGGTGYAVGNTLTVTTGGGNATLRVDAIGGGGAVTSVSIVFPGTGYSTGAGQATSGGAGTGCTVNITAVATGYIRKTGTATWAEAGFLNLTSGRGVVINGTTYLYTGGEGTTTLVGITGNPSAEPAQSVVHQSVITTANSAMTGIPATFSNSLIASLNNQIYVAGANNRSVYVSRTNSYTNYSYTSPIRLVNEGAILTLDGVPAALVPQKDAMYISAGTDQWYQTAFQLSLDNASQSLTVKRLKTTALQGVQSQALVTNIKNTLAFLSFEPTINLLGTAENYFNDPQITDIATSIVNDLLDYTFTNSSGTPEGQIIYWRKNIIVSVPVEGMVLMYNMTDPDNPYWEAPQILPVDRFSIIDGELYGHSYLSSNTYKLFTGYNDDSHAIAAVAKFAFENSGVRTLQKSFDSYYVEGYITSNTRLTLGFQYDMDGAATTTSYQILGTDTQIVPTTTDDASLGTTSLGTNPLGGSGTLSSVTDTPPKFRVEKTFPRVPHFEYQPSFSSYGVDQRWEILAFGPSAAPTTEQPTQIRQ